MMKLWILKAREDLPDEDNPWIPWYDKCFKAIVRADTEEQARQLLTDLGNGAETSSFYHPVEPSPWLDTGKATCTELLTDGEEAVIIEDISHA